MKRVYLDNNATTPIDPRVLHVLTTAYHASIGNPSSVHSFGQEAKALLASARKTIASALGVKPTELLFTSGGTEAANLILRGLLLPGSSDHVITSNVEHAAVYATAQALQQQGCAVSFLPTGTYGAVSPEAVREAIQPNTRLIALMAVNNETGVKTDIPAIAAIAQERDIPFFVDGVAWLGKEHITLPEGVSAASFSAHKIHGPCGVGFAVVRRHLRLQPLITGGGQEDNIRSGTENVPAIAAMAEAVTLATDQINAHQQHMLNLRSQLENGLQDALDGVIINGDGPRICNTSNLAFQHVDGESLLMMLDLQGIAVSHGSACASGSLEPSRVLLNMGLPRPHAASSLRFSLSRFNTLNDIHYSLDVITNIVKKLRNK